MKTEQFIVPVGTAIIIKGLEFEPGVAKLTGQQERIVQQIFNSIEEVTEGISSDPDAARVAGFKKMQFEIHGYAEKADGRENNAALGEARARAVMNFLTNCGTPPWRLKARGFSSNKVSPPKKNGRVELVRTH